MRNQAKWSRTLWLLIAVSCGGRTELELSRSDRVMNDDVARAPSGGRSAAGGHLAGVGGSVAPSGGSPSSGGAATGGTILSTGGVTPSSGGASGGEVSTGGATMGGAGSNLECDAAFECQGTRALQLVLSSYGTSPLLPEVAGCVDFNQDRTIDVYDYLEVIQNWQDGCREPGTLADPGACIFPGDLREDGCYDYFDFFAVLAQEGLTAQNSSPCADVNEDGFVDVLDQARVLGRFRALACEGVDFDPSHLSGDPLPDPMRCGDAPVGELNGDGEVNDLDLAAVLSHLGLPATDPARCLDVDRSGTIDYVDALHVIHASAPSQGHPDCQETLNELEDFVLLNNQCAVDADCAVFDAGCSHVAQHCSRVVYLRTSADEVALSELTSGTAECIGTRTSCRRCETAAPAAACVAGRCVPSAP